MYAGWYKDDVYGWVYLDKLEYPSLPDNVLFTLNENGSLTIKQSAKQLNLPYGKSVNNFTSQFTIPDPTSV